MSRSTLSAPLLLAAALALAACGTTQVQNPVSGRTERTVMDERTEAAEGAKAHEQILQEYGVLNNPGLQQFVNTVGQRLAAQSHRPQLKWTFTVLDSPEVNAFALPGGFVYMTRGMMAYLDSEADLAGVLGHEIGHVTARHGAQRATRQQQGGFAVLGATVLGAVLGGSQGAALGNQISQQYAAGTIARYGREQELQADQLGAEYLFKGGYNPINMVDVIQVLKDQEVYAADAARSAGRAVPEKGNNWLSSHPSSDQRLQEIRQITTRLLSTPGARGPAAFQDDGRSRYLRAMEGVTYGDSREQGVVRGRNFYHEPLGVVMTAPVGWRVNNGAEQVQLVNAEGDAALVMQLIPPKHGTNHEAILRQGLGATEGRTERLALGGHLPATHFNGQRRNAQGQVSPLVATVVTGPQDKVYLLGWVAKDPATMQRARAQLREAELSFRALSAADRTAARPHVLRVAAYPAGGFAQLARQALPAGAPQEQAILERQLRLLNGVYSSSAGQLRVGQPVKVIE